MGGYKDAVSMLPHSKEVAGDLEALIKKIGKERVQIICSGPQDQLDIIKSKMDERLTVKFVTLDAGAMGIAAMPKGCSDTHITILPEFVMPAGREAEFKAGFSKFYDATKGGKGASGCLYYGFGTHENSVYCREGYANAEAALLHGADVKEMLEEPMKAVGAYAEGDHRPCPLHHQDQDHRSPREEVLCLDRRLHPGLSVHLPADVDLQAGVRRVRALHCPPQVLLNLVLSLLFSLYYLKWIT